MMVCRLFIIIRGGGEGREGGGRACVQFYLQTVFWFELTTVQKELLNRC